MKSSNGATEDCVAVDTVVCVALLSVLPLPSSREVTPPPPTEYRSSAGWIEVDCVTGSGASIAVALLDPSAGLAPSAEAASPLAMLIIVSILIVPGV